MRPVSRIVLFGSSLWDKYLLYIRSNIDKMCILCILLGIKLIKYIPVGVHDFWFCIAVNKGYTIFVHLVKELFIHIHIICWNSDMRKY